MANPGVGTKFVSVNLNKSYGQSHNQHQSSHSSPYGLNRNRPGNRVSGGGGGGMVVLSRPRSSQKAGPKLSVPPPLNLPSLCKEHERFDSLGSGVGQTGGGVPGNGARPSSSGMGWTKPGSISLQGKEAFVRDQGSDGLDQGLHYIDDVNRGTSSVYMPPSARTNTMGPTVTANLSSQSKTSSEKATVLRGEDFPSLQAALPAASGPAQRQKDGSIQKQKQGLGNEKNNEQRETSHGGLHVDIRSNLYSSLHSAGLNENSGESPRLGGSRSSEQARKQEDYFPGPSPLVRLNPRSDWADDERDTSHGLIVRGRDQGYSKSESYWDIDFDMPRVSVLPHKPVQNVSGRWGQRDDDTGKVSSSEVPKADPYGKDVKTPSREGREGKVWRNPPLPRNGLSVSEVGNDRYGIGARPSSLNRDIENKSISTFRDNAHSDVGKRDNTSYGQGGRPALNSTMDAYSSRGAERNNRDRNRGDSSHNGSASKSSYSLGSKGLPVNDPLLNFGREKRVFAHSEKTYLEDPFMKDFGATGFDGRDPFTNGLVGVVKRKKDAVKPSEFHDPVRESFEAELERVQKMQEQERQRVIEEQERALEVARREEEERVRLAREHEERQRRLEEEAREAAWRAEQERLDAMRRAEEQKTAREEEKKRILMEEERRKQAAKQKLLELEERIAKRQIEEVTSVTNYTFSVVTEEKINGTVKEKDVSRVSDIGDWEDGERMVERITTSASSDSSSLSRPFEMGSRSQFSNSSFTERGRPLNPWRRDLYENGSSTTFFSQDQDNGHHSPRKDSSTSGRAFSRKEFNGGAGFPSSRISHKGGISEPHADDYTHVRWQRWNLSGDGDHYNRNTDIDSEFHENVERFGDVGWGQNRLPGNSYSPYPDRLYPNSEVDGPYSFGRSRYSMKQPRVLPPPSLAAIQKTSYRRENELLGSPDFLDNEIQYKHPGPATAEPTFQENLGQAEIVQQENTENGEQKPDSNATPRCDSQSTLSVSSPPNSPTLLSHDDFDESGDSRDLLVSREGQDVPASENVSIRFPTKSGEENIMTSSVESTGDEGEWAVNNNGHMQEQEEYDEDEDGYQEEDEVHERDDENIDLTQEFGDMHLEDKMDNLVLGFNEGVEVGMPNDEFDRITRNEETIYDTPQVATVTIKEHDNFEGGQCDGQTHQSVDGSSQVMFHETERAMNDLVILPNADSQTSSVSDLMAQANASSSQASQCSSAQAVISSAPALASQPDVPVKLQFGLFSGPSLIPSPVPAIQIGSIQMPLHLHPQMGTSFSHMHPSQPPLFQFGQLRYTSPISQAVLPLAPQSMSFVQTSVQVGYPLNQNLGGSLSSQPPQDTFARNPRSNDLMPRHLDLSQVNISGESNSLAPKENMKNAVLMPQHQVEISCGGDNNTRDEPGFQAQDQGHSPAVSSKTDSEGQPPQPGAYPFHCVSKEKDLSRSKSQYQGSAGRGKKYLSVRSSGLRSSFPAPENNSRLDANGFQRRPRHNVQREFRVRENVVRRQSDSLVSANHVKVDASSTINGRGVAISVRSGPRNVVLSNLSEQRAESECLSSGPVSDTGSTAEKGARKESLSENQRIPQSGEGNLNRTIHSEEDVDSPLQSGFVRVFEQPGIEAPSNEDNFIEVRSKRQLLNDRRVQREKEIKAKFSVVKMPRKPHPLSRSTMASTNAARISPAMGGETANRISSGFDATKGRGLGISETSTVVSTTILSQPLAPIGTPAAKADSQTLRPLQTSTVPVVTGGGMKLGPGPMYENKKNVLDNVNNSLGSWDNSRINQQVMALTQTQLEEAMKPAQFDSCVSVGDHSSSAGDLIMTTSSILTKDKSFSSTTSPINSLLAGERIQFGAVTSPTILPPSSHAVSHGMGPSASSLSEIQMSHNLSGAENECTLFFEKEEQHSESCSHLEDCEAEAAASAVAVAAISSDEIVGNGLSSCSVSVSDTKSYCGPGTDRITAGSAGDQQLANQSRTEESLSVALPADLSVENPLISLWPPLPSPQSSSNQMLPPFPGGPPSHFPFYDMNPMLGGPVFAFGPRDEPASATQLQPPKSSAPASGPLGAWQQCHSGVDSFYGPPAGFTGPFIGPQGGIPGVRGPPHMVVYNHFAPVGQFGQVGLSFMGTTYIPSGKQPDWKHNGVSTLGIEGEMNNLNMISAQRNTNNVPSAIQHLAPGSPLLPMASSLAMFDVSPFQSANHCSPDMSVQARWPHVPASSIQSFPLSPPLQQQAEGAAPQYTHNPPIDQSLTPVIFPNSRPPHTASDHNRKFSAETDVTVTQLPDELGIVDTSSSASATVAQTVGAAKSLSISDVARTDMQDGNRSNNSGNTTVSSFKTQLSQHKSHFSRYNYQRGRGVSQKNGPGGEWSQRRMGFSGRNLSLGAEKGFPSSKMKQVYVAKQPSSSTSTIREEN